MKDKIMSLLMEYGNETENFHAFITVDEFEDLADDLMKLFSVGPTDECIEEWWSEGNDKKYPDWWERAPYRTNGDVIEEIKTAVKYFNKTNKS